MNTTLNNPDRTCADCKFWKPNSIIPLEIEGFCIKLNLDKKRDETCDFWEEDKGYDED